MRGSLDKINQEKNDHLQAIETEPYQQLTKQIALGRKLSLTTTANWAEGKIFTGTQALALGLINELGSSATVTRVIKEKALIESEIEWIEDQKDLKITFTALNPFSMHDVLPIRLPRSPQQY